MPLTRRVYVEMAQTIKRHVEDAAVPDSYDAIKFLVVDLCGDLKQDNMNFNKDKFLKACGLC